MSDLIERAKAALEGATPGPWQYIESQSPCGQEWLGCGVEDATEHEFIWLEGHGAEIESATARLIALAPDLARALIDTTAERDALRKRVAKLELALFYIQAEANRSNSNIVHIKRIIAAQTRTALQKDTPNE